MRNILKQILLVFAKLTLWRYKPKVVAITGSVGKTSTKEAIACVLASNFSVRASANNYNSEIGVPLTIINEDTGGRNIILWIWIFIKASLKLISTDYPKVLVLELGADRPGDISYLMDLLSTVEAGVLTDIGISHLEFFANPEALAKEKLTLIQKLSKNSSAILNFDNPKIYENRNATNAKLVGYGFSTVANFQISDFQIIHSEGELGTNFKLHHKGTVVPFFLPNTLGKPAVYAATAATAVGFHFGINLVGASQALKKFNPPLGRLRLLDGIKHTKIIDDTYNSAPASVAAALEVLRATAPGRKIAALGDMAELGAKNDWGHRDMASKIIENQVDAVFLVGDKSQITKEELAKRKFSGKVIWFGTADEARIPIQNFLLEHDTILIKGSQSMRMEKIVKEIMADPESAGKLLVRQSAEWLKQA